MVFFDRFVFFLPISFFEFQIMYSSNLMAMYRFIGKNSDMMRVYKLIIIHKMLEIDQQDIKVENVQKEYPALYFDSNSTLKSEINISFNNPNQQLKLPVALLDTMRSDQTLYLLRWSELGLNKILHIRKLSETEWVKITMNYQPERIAITDEHAFIFGSRELFIVSLVQQKINLISLEDAKIVDLKLTYTDLKEPGISIIYFNSKMGYFSKEYSKSSEISFWNKLVAKLPFFAKEKQEYDFFQIILPNLIAIAIQNDSLIIYDLNKMAPTSIHAKFQASSAKYSTICWRFSQSHKGLSEAIDIFILNKNTILLYTLHLALQQQANKNISLQNIARGNVIDWTSSIFEKAQHQINSSSLITGFTVSNEYLIYREGGETLSEIPIINKISLLNLKKESAIISQQSSVWKQYYKDPLKISEFINKFKCQANPERQIFQKQSDSGKKIIKLEGDCLFYLNKWRHYNKFHQFLVYQGQIYIVRLNSINILEDIPQLQFQLQNYNEEDRLRDQQLKIENLLDKGETKLAHFDKNQIEKEYKTIINEVKRAAELVQNSNTQKLKSLQHLPCKFTVVFNIFRDRIQYFSQIIKYSITRLNIRENSNKNTQIARFIRYFQGSFLQENQYSILGTNLLALFIQKNQKELTPINELNLILVLKKLLRNLLPDSFIAELGQHGLLTNEYLEFLVNFIIFSKSEPITILTQNQIRKLISEVYPSLDDKTQFNLLNNASFIKAYILSHPQESELLPYFQRLINSSSYRAIIENLKQIFHLIPNQMDLLIRTQLSLKKNQLSSKIFANQSLKSVEAKTVAPRREYKQMAKLILSFECDRDSAISKYESDLQLIKKYLEQVDNSHFLTFDEAEKKLMKVYREQMQISVAHEEFSHILEIEEAVLRSYTKLFNRELPKINNIQFDKFHRFQDFFLRLLDQIELSFFNFKKSFTKLYDFNQKEGLENLNLQGITKRINFEESLMSNQFLSEPIKIQNYCLSQIFIFLLKKITSSEGLLKLSAKYLLDHRSDDFVDQVLGQLLSESEVTSEQMDCLYFYLLKKGEKYIRRVLAKTDRQSALNIMKYLQNIEERDILYLLSSEAADESKLLTDFKRHKQEIK